MTLIGYLRVSTEEQAKSHLGLDAQKNALEKYAKDNNKEIILFEECKSGSLPIHKRPGLIDALDHLKKDDILLVYRRDRLSRDPQVMVSIQLFVDKVKARIISYSGEGTDNDDPSSILFRSILDCVANFERLIIAKRTKDAMNIKRQKKELIGRIPFGFQLAEDNKTLIPHPQEQEVVKLMLKLHNEENLSYYKIAKVLTEQNILKRDDTKKKTTWNQMNVIRIINNVNNYSHLLI